MEMENYEHYETVMKPIVFSLEANQRQWGGRADKKQKMGRGERMNGGQEERGMPLLSEATNVIATKASIVIEI